MNDHNPGLLVQMRPTKRLTDQTLPFNEIRQMLQRIIDTAGVDPFLACIVCLSFHKRSSKDRRRKHDLPRLGEASLDLCLRGVRKHRLSQNEVKLPVKRAQREMSLIAEDRPLEAQRLLAKLLVDPFINQPLLGLDSKVSPRQEVRNEKPS